MRALRLLLSPLLLWTATLCQAGEYRSVRLVGEDGERLTLMLAGGKSMDAPKLGTQDSFERPMVSRDGSFVGWLALYPGRGASYSLPLELVVMDSARRIHRFSGDWGMVFGWCFAPGGRAVIYRYSFPHGDLTPWFDMRDVRDGRLLKQFRMPGVDREVDLMAAVRAKAPVWTRCAQQRDE